MFSIENTTVKAHLKRQPGLQADCGSAINQDIVDMEVW